LTLSNRHSHFVALKVPHLAGLRGLIEKAPSEIQWYRDSDLHLAVASLGPMEPSRTDAVLEAIEAIEFKPIKVRLSRLVALPHRRRPSSFSFQIDLGHHAVGVFIREHREGLIRAAGGKPDESKLSPCITVARPPLRAEPAALDRLLGWVDAQAPLDDKILLSELALYRTQDNNPSEFQLLGP
jgi:2'-5' RNA ligase